MNTVLTRQHYLVCSLLCRANGDQKTSPFRYFSGHLDTYVLTNGPLKSNDVDEQFQSWHVAFIFLSIIRYKGYVTVQKVGIHKLLT